MNKSLVMILRVIFALQLLVFMIFVFGDIGFDHPGRFGLDFEDAILLFIAFVFISLFGITISIVKRRWDIVFRQLAIIFSLSVIVLFTQSL